MSAIMSDPTRQDTKAQQKLRCKLIGCAAMVEFCTHDMRSELFISAEILLEANRKTKNPWDVVRVSITSVEAKELKLVRADDPYDDGSVWIRGMLFRLDPKDIDRAAEFLAPLGIRISDERKPK